MNASGEQPADGGTAPSPWPPGTRAAIPGAGTCRALVLGCIDYRFVEPLRRHLGARGLGGAYDLLSWPGGATALTTSAGDALLNTIDLACELHDPDQIILVAHHDCARFGGTSAFVGRDAEVSALYTSLAVAADMVRDRQPDRQVRLVRLDFDGASTDHLIGDPWGGSEAVATGFADALVSPAGAQR